MNDTNMNNILKLLIIICLCVIRANSIFSYKKSVYINHHVVKISSKLKLQYRRNYIVIEKDKEYEMIFHLFKYKRNNKFYKIKTELSCTTCK